jgi:hypothetical protein
MGSRRRRTRHPDRYAATATLGPIYDTSRPFLAMYVKIRSTEASVDEVAAMICSLGTSRRPLARIL